MSDAQDLQHRLMELGQRYLKRTATELEELNALIARIASGDDSLYRDIEVIVHRIRGSGAMFGFSAVSDAAGAMEVLSSQAKSGQHQDRLATQARLQDMTISLERAVRDARAVRPNASSS